MYSDFENWSILADYEHWDEVNREIDYDEIREKLTPITRIDPEVYKELFGVDIPALDTIPNYIYQYIDYERYIDYRKYWTGSGVAVVMTFDGDKNLHSFGGKAAIETEKDKFTHKEWCLHGVRHRTDGPAVCYGGQEEYWLEGEYIDIEKEAFDVYRFNKGYSL
jgi:hypothetical protein